MPNEHIIFHLIRRSACLPTLHGTENNRDGSAERTECVYERERNEDMTESDVTVIYNNRTGYHKEDELCCRQD